MPGIRERGSVVALLSAEAWTLELGERKKVLRESDQMNGKEKILDTRLQRKAQRSYLKG